MSIDMVDAVAQEVEGRHLDDPTEEGIVDLGESRQSELLLLSQGAIDVVGQHEGEFATLVKDAWRHLEADESRSKRRVIDDLFEQVCERLNLEVFRVTAEHVKLLEISSDVDSDEEGRLLHCSLWVLTKGYVGEKTVGFDLLVNSCKVKYLLGLVKMVGNANHWKDEDLWDIYGQLFQLHASSIESVVRQAIYGSQRFSAKGQNREPQELSCAAVKAKSEKLTPRSARILWLLLVVGATVAVGTWSATPYGTRNRYPSQKNQGQAILG
ncbi:hypothetical protein B0J15DRAFT_527542 [Fusarium solani]|uniref:Uncharacterized protein n=1 Tax=Fusarium solani TaxID=169388 RepID=A0A9P9KCV2_FUSSL|nr:uncharacterized protein B0J15DRAFT_527542 [Fusarium solani]KAH7248354.1 hypothetical protein B0J15DRAFT_527542 [Fusarium solani]